MNDAADRSEAADDDDEEDLERAVEVEAGRLDRAEIGEGPEHAGDADDEGAHREGEELGLQHRDADHLRGDLVVAHGDEIPPGARAYEPHGEEREDETTVSENR